MSHHHGQRSFLRKLADHLSEFHRPTRRSLDADPGTVELGRGGIGHYRGERVAHARVELILGPRGVLLDPIDERLELGGALPCDQSHQPRVISAENFGLRHKDVYES